MKNILLTLGLVLVLVACSSDNSEPIDNGIVENPSNPNNPNNPEVPNEPVNPDNPNNPQNPNTITDIDGNVYQTFVAINGRRWMKENLKVARLNDGLPLMTNISNANWMNSQTTPSFSVYDNSEVNNNKYGKLYNFASVKTGKLCPQGWHIPTFDEFNNSFRLNTYIVGQNNISLNHSSPLKDVGSWLGWPSYNTTGFTALPSGYRNDAGYFVGIGEQTTYWSSTILQPLPGLVHELAWTYSIEGTYEYIEIALHSAGQAFSCRCIEDL